MKKSLIMLITLFILIGVVVSILFQSDDEKNVIKPDQQQSNEYFEGSIGEEEDEESEYRLETPSVISPIITQEPTLTPVVEMPEQVLSTPQPTEVPTPIPTVEQSQPNWNEGAASEEEDG